MNTIKPKNSISLINKLCMSHVGKQILKLCLDNNISIEQMCEMCKISPQKIYLLLANKGNFNIQLLYTICFYFNKDIKIDFCDINLDD